jgi:hypothetical protein
VLTSLQQRSGFRLIPVTPADGYFHYIAESVVNADFTEAKRNRQGVKKSIVFFLLKEYNFPVISPEAFLSCFKLCELGVIPVLVNIIPDTIM